MAQQRTLELHSANQVDAHTERLFSNRDLFLLIGPLVVEQLLSILTGLVDSIMVARVGEAAVSGVSLIDNTMVLLIYIFAALATGGAVIAGQFCSLGAISAVSGRTTGLCRRSSNE